MTSLKRRFLAVAALTIAAALLGAGFVFVHLFSNNLARRIDNELTNYVNQIAGELQFAADGTVKAPVRLSDPRFSRAYSGLYWQIDDFARKDRLRSRSLWDFVLALPDDDHIAGDIHRYRLAGPEGTRVIVQERSLVIAAPGGARTIRVAAALDEAGLVAARDQFMVDMVPYLVVLGLFLLIASGLQLSLGLRPLAAISRQLDAIRDRRKQRLEGKFPNEIARLAGAVNNLLEVQEKSIGKARARAGDLAHGLKTPLTVLANDAETLIGRGDAEIGGEIGEMVQTMQLHIDRELARARLVPEPALRKGDAIVHVIVGDVLRTLQRTPHGEKLDWQVDLPGGQAVKVDPGDLRELAGNIVENAAKWARSSVRVSSRVEGRWVVLRVDDDGPGVDDAAIGALTERGKRFDEQRPGSGIGLAIVRDIADVYDLEFSIRNLQTNGLCAEVSLPLAGAPGGKVQNIKL